MTARAYNVLEMPAREVDCIIAQRLFGYVEVQGPRVDDYGAEIESCLILMSPRLLAQRDPWAGTLVRDAIPRDYWVPNYTLEDRQALEAAHVIRPHAWVDIRLGKKLDIMDVPAIEATIGRYGMRHADFSARASTLSDALARVCALWADRPK